MNILEVDLLIDGFVRFSIISEKIKMENDGVKIISWRSYFNGEHYDEITKSYSELFCDKNYHPLSYTMASSKNEFIRINFNENGSYDRYSSDGIGGGVFVGDFLLESNGFPFIWWVLTGDADFSGKKIISILIPEIGHQLGITIEGNSHGVFIPEFSLQCDFHDGPRFSLCGQVNPGVIVSRFLKTPPQWTIGQKKYQEKNNKNYELKKSNVTGELFASKKQEKSNLLFVFIGGTGEYSPLGILRDGSSIGYEKIIFALLALGSDVFSIGHSETTEVVSFFDYLKLISNKINELNYENMVIVGHSFGGVLAAALVSYEFISVSGIVFLSTPFNPINEIISIQANNWRRKNLNSDDCVYSVSFESMSRTMYAQLRPQEFLLMKELQGVGISDFLENISNTIKFVIFHGTEDEQVMSSESVQLYDYAVKNFFDASLYLFSDLDHVFAFKKKSLNKSRNLIRKFVANNIAKLIFKKIKFLFEN